MLCRSMYVRWWRNFSFEFDKIFMLKNFDISCTILLDCIQIEDFLYCWKAKICFFYCWKAKISFHYCWKMEICSRYLNSRSSCKSDSNSGRINYIHSTRWSHKPAYWIPETCLLYPTNLFVVSLKPVCWIPQSCLLFSLSLFVESHKTVCWIP